MFCNCIALGLRQAGHAFALGQILPDESVGVLVGAAFRTVVRRGEVELHGADRLHLFIPVELPAPSGAVLRAAFGRLSRSARFRAVVRREPMTP